MQHRNYPNRSFQHIISAPFIYYMFFPTLFLDISLEIYHRICFPLYGIPYVKRNKYIRIDRQKLEYLDWFEKFNCMYCGYANGLYAYAVAVAGETETYWCGIQHKKSKGMHTPKHHKKFAEYGSEKSLKESLKNK